MSLLFGLCKHYYYFSCRSSSAIMRIEPVPTKGTPSFVVPFSIPTVSFAMKPSFFVKKWHTKLGTPSLSAPCRDLLQEARLCSSPECPNDNVVVSIRDGALKLGAERITTVILPSSSSSIVFLLRLGLMSIASEGSTATAYGLLGMA